jgi:cell wall-associated NlpC family hydrolase
VEIWQNKKAAVRGRGDCPLAAAGIKENMITLTNKQKKLLRKIAYGFEAAELPYVYGAEVNLKTTPEECIARRLAFDCSEFIEYLFFQVLGARVPDGALYQYAYVKNNKVSKPEIGCLVFKQDKNRYINHVAVVVDEKPVVKIAEFEGFYKKIIIRPLTDFLNVKPAASQPVEGVFGF